MRKILYRCWLLAIGCWLFAACTETVSDAKQETAQPDIYPDYIGVTIPVNIAPLNFSMTDETALRIDAVITDRHGHELHSQGDDAVDFDLDDWHTLLGDNRSDSLTVTVSAKYDDGWHTYRPFALYVSPDSIDYGLCYRLIAPGYEVWSKMGIICLEMEAAALYMNAARWNKKALAIFTISDEIYSGRELSAEDRQKSFTKMMELALETAV